MDPINIDGQDVELDPNDIWLMRAAGGEDELEDNVVPIIRAPDDDQFSFEDSERFEEDSLCSWMSDAESLNQNWRGWSATRNSAPHGPEHNFGETSAMGLPISSLRYTGGISSTSQNQHGRHSVPTSSTNPPLVGSPIVARCSNSSSKTGITMRNLAEIAARVAAKFFSFAALESSYDAIMAARRSTLSEQQDIDSTAAFNSAYTEHVAIPDKFFLSIVRWCFPESEEDVRLYSCLANGNAEEFTRGEYLYQTDSVHDVFQIGYHISAVIDAPTAPPVPTSAASSAPTCRLTKTTFNVSVRVDRCRIVSCCCSCAFKASWCQHVVAVCLYRINRSSEVEYRVTIWDSINELSNEKLKKLAQFLINELPRQYLPIAQRLIDNLRDPNSEINAAVGAPDPTDGGHDELAIWCLDQRTLHENIRRILIKFCIPSPTVHCDVQYLSSNQPPAASEWQSLLRPHRSKDPEGLWNLLSIVREMFRRRDENATSLLHIITEEILACSQVLIWWYQTSLSQSGYWTLCPPTGNKSSSLLSNQKTPQFNCASLCDEVVQLWRLAALNPRLSSAEKEQLTQFIQFYHRSAVERIWKIIYSLVNGDQPVQSQTANAVMSIVDRYGERLNVNNARFTVDVFPGFLRALKACQICWAGVTIEGFQSNNIAAGKTKLLPLNCSLLSPSYHLSFSPTTIDGTNFLVPRRSLKFFDEPSSSDITTRSSAYSSTSNCHSLQNSRKKRKKTARMARRHIHTFEFHDEHSLYRAVRAAANAAREEALGEEIEDDSVESGQESEEGPFGVRAANLSQQSGDTFGMNVRNDAENANASRIDVKFPSNDVDELFAIAHVQQSNWDIKFARCEALMSHGYTQTACELAIDLAKEMLRRPPSLLLPAFDKSYSLEMVNMFQRHKKHTNTSFNNPVNSQSNESIYWEISEQLIEKSQLAENILTRTLFLVQTLMKESKTHHIAFSLAMSVLELPRNPSATKFLEVKLYYLEAELVALLRKIEIGNSELQMIRDKARTFLETTRILTAYQQPRVLPLALGHYILDALSYSHNAVQGRKSSSGIVTKSNVLRRPADEDLAIKVALETLAIKLMVCEADYPMLFESTRRQRGELALTMLVRYKDCNDKLALILDKLLDPTMHRMYKDSHTNALVFLEANQYYMNHLYGRRPDFEILVDSKSNSTQDDTKNESTESAVKVGSSKIKDGDKVSMAQLADKLLHMNQESQDSSRPDALAVRRRSSEISSDSQLEGSSASVISHDTQPELHSVSTFTSNSSSPIRRLSSVHVLDATSDITASTTHSNESTQFYRSNRRKMVINQANQASEAHAHYMMELAKRLLVEAGGSQSTVIFNASHNLGNQNNPQPNGPHRQLHICSFLTGLYALGLNNLLSPSWQTRTYSTNVSWIHGQAIEIGCTAIKVVERVWESHLTPTEVAALADKASQSRDPCMVESGASLALSVLPEAYALTAAESQKALNQCKEQSMDMLEKACRAVEKAAEKDGVYPEVLFKVARHWYDLYLLSEPVNSQKTTNQLSSHAPPRVTSSAYAPVKAPMHSDVVQQQMPQNFISTSNPPPVQFSMQCNVMQRHQQVPYVAHSYFMSNCHQNTPTHCPPPTFVPPVSCAQQLIYQQPRGHAPVQPVPTVQPVQAVQVVPPPPAQQSSNIFLPQHAGASQRALHASHSAPNLSPLQAAQISRRNQQTLATLSSSTAFAALPMQCQYQPPNDQLVQAQVAINAPLHHHGPPPNSVIIHPNIMQPPSYYIQQSSQAPPLINNVSVPAPNNNVGDPNMAKLVHAHRVGLIAMETMGNRNHDDNRSYAKFSQNPTYADDVHWLFSVATKLGGVFFQSFCDIASRSIASPFVLFTLAVESTKVFPWQVPTISYHTQTMLHATRPQLPGTVPNVRAVMLQHGFSTSTSDLMHRCIEMFYVAAGSKLSHPRFVPSDIEEVLQLVKTAKEAFHWIPGPGKLMFDDFMRHVRKQKAFKKEVAHRINAYLTSSPTP